MRMSSLELEALAGAATGLRSTVAMAALINAGVPGLPRQLTRHVARVAASLGGRWRTGGGQAAVDLVTNGARRDRRPARVMRQAGGGEPGRAGNGLGVLGVVPTAKAAVETGVKHSSARCGLACPVPSRSTAPSTRSVFLLATLRTTSPAGSKPGTPPWRIAQDPTLWPTKPVAVYCTAPVRLGGAD